MLSRFVGILLVTALVMAGGSIGSGDELKGLILDANGNPVIGEPVMVEACNTQNQYTLYTDGNGEFSGSAGLIGISQGDCYKVTVQTTNTCGGSIPVTDVSDTTIVSWDPGTYSTTTTLGQVGGPTWGSSLSLGKASSDWANGGAVSTNNKLGFARAQAASGSFDVSADFEFDDAYNDGQAPIMNRWYDFELTVTYIGYIDTNCAFQAATNSYIDGDTFGESTYVETTGTSSGVQAISLTGLSSSQGQPGSALYIVVRVDAHVLNVQAAIFVRGSALPTPADFTASGTYWVIP